jgi:hypothetical protein
VKEKINFKSNSFAWDVEFLYKAKKAGFKILSLPIIYKRREKGESKIKMLTPVKMLIELLKIRFVK